MYKMPLTSKDIVSLSQARASLTELCEEVRTKGTEKIVTKNGGSVAALMAPQLDDLLLKGHDLRELIAHDYFILYVVGRAQIAFLGPANVRGPLAIKHHRELAFDLKHFWQNE